MPSDPLSRQELDAALALAEKANAVTGYPDDGIMKEAFDLVPRLVEDVLRWRRKWASTQLTFDCSCATCSEARAILAEKE